MISLTNPTGRKTEARIVEIGAHSLYFSYATCIAYCGPLGTFRRPNHWGPTTGRHFRELECDGFPIDENGLDHALNTFAEPSYVLPALRAS